jgi:methionyl-tRNA formyltransferase
MKKKIIIACSKRWFTDNEKVKKYLIQNKKTIEIITKKKYLNLKNLNKIQPNIIFFPHWSYLVNEKIVNKFKCICFHSAPLPYGRGGSPIQNLIIRNYKSTPLYALQMSKKLDSGPIYLRQNLSLKGNLKDILNLMAIKILKMIKIILKKKIHPKNQKGKIFIFKRLKEKNSEIKKEKNINKIYDKIRMLDADEYPKSFIKIGKFKIYFFNAIKRKNHLICTVKIV